MSVIVGYVPTKEGRAALSMPSGSAGYGSATSSSCSRRAGRRARTDEFAGHVQAAREDLGAAGLAIEITTGTEGNDPAEDLIEAAEGGAGDLIVIGLRRRTPIGKLILGSNAQRILLDAPCPVIAVKAEA
jgi:nucleotide-binding universal stress UspA family protein